MGFTSRDQILARKAAGYYQRWNVMKDGSTNTPEAAGSWYSSWTDPGMPGAAANPTTYANCTDFAGSIFNSNVSPGKRYLTDLALTASQNGTIMLYDRLGHIGSISLASTGDKTVSSSALPRSMDAVDAKNVECWVEVTTATTVTAPIISMNSYTDYTNGAARAGGSLTFPSTATNVGWMGKLGLQAGDISVTAVSTINVATAASAGICNVVLLRPLAFVPVIANLATVWDLLPNLPRVYDGSSIGIAFLSTSTSAVDIWGTVEFTYDS